PSAPGPGDERLCQPIEPAVDVGAEVEAQHAAVVSSEHIEIAERLGALQRAEAEALVGNPPIALVAHDLEEYAAIGSALVELPGGVEEARAVAERGGGARAPLDSLANRLQGAVARRCGVEEGEEREVVTRTEQARQPRPPGDRVRRRGHGGL